MSNQNYTTEVISKLALRRQHLTPETLGRKESLTEIVRDIGGLHAQIFDSVYLALWNRMKDFHKEWFDQATFDEKN